MNTFYLYEQGNLVATANDLTISIAESTKCFKLWDIIIFPQFHLLNGYKDSYEIKFEAETASGFKCQYTLGHCIFKDRSSVSSDLKHINYIEGTFDSLDVY